MEPIKELQPTQGPDRDENAEKLEEINLKIGELKKNYQKDSAYGKWFGVMTLALIVLIILHYSKILTLSTWVLVPIIILAILLSLAMLGNSSSTGEYKSELETLQTLKRIHLGLPDSPEQDYYEKLIKLNIENLTAHYTLVKLHTQSSFRLTFFSSLIGFILLVIGIAIGYYKQDLSIASITATGSGLIIEFISGVLFVQYQKTISQLRYYHKSLIGVQNVLLSIKLIENIRSDDGQGTIVSKLIEGLTRSSGSLVAQENEEEK